jgi:3-oxoacyl-(acyl-carrier-protein) synthase
MSVLSPIGNTLEEFWRNSVNGTVGYSFEEFKGEKFIIGKVPHFENLGSSKNPTKVKMIGETTNMALNATIRAINDAAINLKNVDKYRVGVCVANAISNTPYCEEIFNGLEETEDVNIYRKGMFSFITYEIANEFDLRGENFVMSTGCTGGIDAIGYAFETIRDGEHDIMICGAVETPISMMTIKSFEAIGALAKNFHDMPTKASCPFDKKRNGFVLSEGSAILILESYEEALKRGAKIYAEVMAYESCNNAYHMTDLSEDGEALGELIIKSLTSANMNLEQIDYINAHGSSTIQNDIFETNAYKIGFGYHAKNISISSTKSMTGHPLAAASAIETVLSILSMQYNTIPPTVNLDEQDECCDLNFTPNSAVKKEIKTVLTNANGFSGLHSVLILSKIK